MDGKKGDLIYSLPVDPKQDIGSVDMSFINSLVKSTPSKQKAPPKMHEQSDSDSDSGSDSDSEEPVESHKNDVSMWTEIKATFLASLIYVILSMETVDSLIRKTGLDGLNLMLLKVFVFAIIYFVLRYKFL